MGPRMVRVRGVMWSFGVEAGPPNHRFQTGDRTMKKETKVVALWYAASVCWAIGTVLALPAYPFNRLGNWFRNKGHFIQFGEHL